MSDTNDTNNKRDIMDSGDIGGLFLGKNAGTKDKVDHTGVGEGRTEHVTRQAMDKVVLRASKRRFKLFDLEDEEQIQEYTEVYNNPVYAVISEENFQKVIEKTVDMSHDKEVIFCRAVDYTEINMPSLIDSVTLAVMSKQIPIGLGVALLGQYLHKDKIEDEAKLIRDKYNKLYSPIEEAAEKVRGITTKKKKARKPKKMVKK